MDSDRCGSHVAGRPLLYPSVELFQWLKTLGWHTRLRLKGNMRVDTGMEDETTTGHWPKIILNVIGGTCTCLAPARSWRTLVSCMKKGIRSLGSLPRIALPRDRRYWITAPVRAIEPTFSDFKSRGFQLEDSHLKHPAHLERLILIMALGHSLVCTYRLPWRGAGPDTARKKPRSKLTPRTGALKNSGVAWCHGSSAACDTWKDVCKMTNLFQDFPSFL